ncbi:MAG: A/G-specific adenine glycosylase [Verrucomicrobiales bacterium]|nr:A/G-specific adenine glycosylase [Verrucomicrobiales bacterium]
MAGQQTTESDWSQEEIEAFQSAITGWFQSEGKDLPWRRTTDPYRILVSELMLQQTRVETVLKRGFYDRWLETFPDAQSLATAPEEAVLKAWEGLGYYNRARNLQKAARVIVEDRNGEFPDSLEGMLELPGVGRYTAGAVLSFAFGKRAPLVDGNVARLFSRIFLMQAPIDSTAGKKRLWDLAEQMTPDRLVREYNSGLMEIGQRFCRPGSNPDCSNCPIAVHCRGHEVGVDLGALPKKQGKIVIENKTEDVGFFFQDDRIFLSQEQGSRRKGMWRLPSIVPRPGRKELFTVHYTITKYRVEMRVYKGVNENLPERIQENGGWFEAPEETDSLAIPSPDRRALKILIDGFISGKGRK